MVWMRSSWLLQLLFRRAFFLPVFSISGSNPPRSLALLPVLGGFFTFTQFGARPERYTDPSLAFRYRSEPSNARSTPVARRKAAAEVATALVSRNYRRDHTRTGLLLRCPNPDHHHTAFRNSPSV